MSLLSLPDDILENILARISKWTYPNLSLVSKRFFSLLSSPQLYMERSRIGTTELCLYCCLNTVNHSSPRWFTLWMKPDEILTNNDETLNDYTLIPLRSSPSEVLYQSTVAVGLEIYVIGGIFKPSSSVRILDCRSHTWRDAPNMTVARVDPAAVLIDQKIYVIGGCRIDESSDNWFEVLDIETQTWRALPSPRANHELRRYIMPSFGDNHKIVKFIKVNPNALEGKLYVAAKRKEYTYEPKDGTWKIVRKNSNIRSLQVWCVIENVMYSYSSDGSFMWYDYEGRYWREVRGLEELRRHPTRGLYGSKRMRIVNYGGKLVVMWSVSAKQKSGERKTQIWYAKIALEKRNNNEIWGKTEWINHVLTLRKVCYFCFTCVAILI